MMEIRAVRTPGLGDSTYVLVHDGVAVVVDPQLDHDRFVAVIEDTGAQPRFVLETHVHNDYLSGGLSLSREIDAELVFPAGAAPVFRHRPAFHHEDIDGGPLKLRPMHTPGHTPEHVSYLVIIEGRPVAVFSGGSLLVGSAGRSDLLGAERAETLARLQYGSVSRLASLPDDVGLYPTHGAGSFCTVSPAGSDTSTIGEERRHNPALIHTDEESFVSDHLSGLVPYPSYYAHMAPANLKGTEAPRSYEVPPIAVVDLEAIPDLVVIDARPGADFARGHLPGSISIELREDFGVWAGWVVPSGSTLALVVNPDQSVEEGLRQLARIGLEKVAGIITWPVDVEVETASFRTVDVEDFAAAVVDGAQILDTRAPDEWERGVIASSTLAYVPELVEENPAEIDPSREVWVACASGYRAGIAASFLERRGIEPVVLTPGGVHRVLKVLSNRGATEWRAHPSNGGSD
jgi:glyoxylase-like metal-dependent hydrolase (beta-lactamase superfamily II)